MSKKITVNEAAKQLNVTPKHVRRLIKGGHLLSFRTTPRKTMVYTESIDALIRANDT